MSSLEEQISRAEQAVYKNKAASETLQSQWKKHLLHMSYLLAMIGVHQWQSHVTPCVKEIKDFNREQEFSFSDIRVGGGEAVQIVLRDSLEYIVALFMTACLLLFLTSQQQPGKSPRVNFSSSWPYMFTNACVPVILGLHFQRGNARTDSASVSSSCLAEFLAHHRFTSRNLNDSRPPPSFPVVVVFHLIVTASFWFMDSQARQQERNVESVVRLRRDLVTARDDRAPKRPADGGTGKWSSSSQAPKDKSS